MSLRIIDGDSHFLEPLNLWEQRIDSKFRDRAVRFREDPSTGSYTMSADGKPLPEYLLGPLFGDLAAYGKKEKGEKWDQFDETSLLSPEWQDMGKRIEFLNHEKIDAQIIYPTMAILWETVVTDPALAAAHCRAYNTWAFEMVADHKDRMFPGAHLSMRDPALAVKELDRVAKLGARTAFVAAIPVGGKSFGHPDYDPIWAAAQDLNISVSVHISFHLDYAGTAWYRDRTPGMMYLSVNAPQEPRLALTAMMFDGVFERFPKIRVATVEAKSGWVGEWLERMDYHFGYQGHHSQMKMPATDYFNRNIWIQCDPAEKMLPHVIQVVGDDKFFMGSDYPHGEGFPEPVATTRKALAGMPNESVDKILGANAAAYYSV